MNGTTYTQYEDSVLYIFLKQNARNSHITESKNNFLL